MNKNLIIRLVQVLAGCAIAAAGLYLFFRDVNPARLLEELSRGSIVAYASCIALSFLSLWLRAIRWGIMLPQTPGTHKRGLFSFVMIGFMVNNILPARLGEAVRVFLIWKKNGFAPATAIGAFFLERIIDVFVFGTFFFVPVLMLPQLSHLVPFALIILAGFAGFVLFLAAMSRWPHKVKEICVLLSSKLPGKVGTGATKIINDLFANLDWLQSPRRVVQVTLLSFAVTVPFALQVQLLAAQAGGLGFFEGLFVQACASLGAAIPLSPGYVGTLHAFMLQGLTLMGIEPDSARAITILYHALSFVPITALGLYYFFKADLHFSDITRARSEIAA